MSSAASGSSHDANGKTSALKALQESCKRIGLTVVVLVENRETNGVVNVCCDDGIMGHVIMNGVIIRRATLADAELLAVLNKDVQQIHADALPKLFKQPDNLAEVVADFQTRILADVDGLVLIAEADQQAVGYIYAKVVTRPENAYTFTQKLMLVDQISVRPSDQHKGYGQLLMQAVRDEASARGVQRIVLDMYSFNSNAQHFYAKMGFERLSFRMALDFN